MRKFEVMYDPEIKEYNNQLRILYSDEDNLCVRIGSIYVGKEADLMFKLLSAIDTSKLDDSMSLIIKVRNSEGFYDVKVND